MQVAEKHKIARRVHCLIPEILSLATYWNGESSYFLLNAHMDLTGTNGVHFSYATNPVKFHWDTAQNIKMCQDEPSVTKITTDTEIKKEISPSIYLLLQIHPIFLDQDYRYVIQLKNNWFIILMVN